MTATSCCLVTPLYTILKHRAVGEPFAKTRSQAFTNVRNRPLYLGQDEQPGVRAYVLQ